MGVLLTKFARRTQEVKTTLTMATDEAALAAEIARLEAELERARVESEKQHQKANLHAELTAVGKVLNEDEYAVIKDMIDDTGEEEYVEYTEHSYDEYEEEEYEEEYTEGSEYEEIIEDSSSYEEEIVQEEDEPVASQGSSRPALSQLMNAQLKKAPMSARQQKEKEEAERAAEAAKARAAARKPLPTTNVAKKKAKKPVRPPPNKGGKPVPRKEIEVQKKAPKKFPLSRLLQRNKNSTTVGNPPPMDEKVEAAPTRASKAAAAPPATKKAAPKKKLVRRVVKKPKEGTKTKAALGGPFKRRIIPNTQPSPPGEETIFEQLLGSKLITNPKLHKSSTKGCVKDQELICLYFAAQWKSDCKRFNPLIKDFYYNVAQQNNLEVIYISADRSLLEFKDCYATMPFLAMPAGTTSLKNELTKALKVIEMPALVVLDDEGMVVSVQGAQKIRELEKGNVKQANELVDRWKKTRPIPISEVQKDETLLHGTMDRGTLYWN